MTVELNKIYHGDALQVLRELPAEVVDCVVTSPPYYGLRNYGVNGLLRRVRMLKSGVSRWSGWFVIIEKFKGALKPL